MAGLSAVGVARSSSIWATVSRTAKAGATRPERRPSRWRSASSVKYVPIAATLSTIAAATSASGIPHIPAYTPSIAWSPDTESTVSSSSRASVRATVRRASLSRTSRVSRSWWSRPLSSTRSILDPRSRSSAIRRSSASREARSNRPANSVRPRRWPVVGE